MPKSFAAITTFPKAHGSSCWNTILEELSPLGNVVKQLSLPSMRMKKTTIAALIMAGSVLQPLLGHADDLYQMAWRGKVFTTGANGQIVAGTISEQDFIRKAATDNGLDPRGLAFVYRPNKHDTAVVRLSDGGFVADVIQMEYSYTDVSNPDQTATIRQAFLSDEAHSGAIGSACGAERLRRNANGDLIAYSFNGTFQYALPDSKAVYTGSFATGRRIRDTSGG